MKICFSLFQSLGLLINLVEYSKKNLLALNAASAPPLLNGSNEENTACSEKDDTSAVESLMHLFMVKLEAAKSNSGMEEDLAKLNSETFFSLYFSSEYIELPSISPPPAITLWQVSKVDNETPSHVYFSSLGICI